MGYRVQYEIYGKFCKKEENPGRQISAMTISFFLLFFMLVNGFWPRGRDVLQELLWPGDAAVTSAALEGFAHELKMGASLGEAVEGFCREVIADGELCQN